MNDLTETLCGNSNSVDIVSRAAEPFCLGSGRARWVGKVDGQSAFGRRGRTIGPPIAHVTENRNVKLVRIITIIDKSSIIFVCKVILQSRPMLE